LIKTKEKPLDEVLIDCLVLINNVQKKSHSWFPFGKQSRASPLHGFPSGNNQGLRPCMVTDALADKNVVFVKQTLRT